MNAGDNLKALVIIDDSDSEAIPIQAQYGGGTVSFSGCLIGIQRETFDEMYELYCKHAREVGFWVRKSTQRTNTIGEVIEKYYVLLESTVQRWRSKEQADEFECLRAIPASRLPLVGMLKQASELYTLSVFRDFEDEFLKSISSIVKTIGEELEVRVYDVQNHDEPTAQRVNFYSEDNYISCTCRRFEEYGLLCSHRLRIFDRHSVKEIPGCYILKRWTKLAKKDLWDKADTESHTSTDLLHSVAWRHKMAMKYYTILLKAQANEDARRIVENGSKSILDEVQSVMSITNLVEDTEVSSSSISVLDPAKAKTKGRKKRIKGQLEKVRKKKSNAEGSSNQLSEFGSKTPNPRLF